MKGVVVGGKELEMCNRPHVMPSLQQQKTTFLLLDLLLVFACCKVMSLLLLLVSAELSL